MSAQPPSSPNPLDEFKAGIADKQPLVQGNQPRYAFGWFDKWLLIIPAILLILCLLLGWFALNPTAPPTDTVTLNAPAGGTTVTVGQPVELGGTAPPGAEVQLFNHDKLVATTQADADGKYQFNLMPTQPGEYVVKSGANINGQSVQSPALTFTVAAAVAANATPAATSPAGATPGAPAGNVTFAASTPASQAAAQTQAASNANNALTPTLVVGTADANTAATLDATVAQTAQASEPVTVTAESASGNTPAAAEATAQAGESVTVTAASASGNTPAAAEATAQAGESATVTAESADANTPTAAEATAQALSTVTSASTAVPVTLTPSSVETNTALLNPPTMMIPASGVIVAGSVLTGAAPPNSTVILYADDVGIAHTQADANGNWQIIVPVTIPSGKYTLRVAVLDANGQTIRTSQPQIVTIVAPTQNATPSAPPTSTASSNPPTINLEPNGVILPGESLTGSAPPNSHIVLYFNDNEIARAAADANGMWVIVVPTSLAPGKYNVRVAVVDANGKIIVSAPQEIVITVATKPLLPVTGGKWWRAPRHCR